MGASALTVHKSQGGTFPEIVYEYDKGQEQQLVYVGLSIVTSIEGLFLTNTGNVFKFHHAKGSASPRIQELRTELQRLGNHKLVTLGSEIREFITNGSHSAVLMSLNVQSLNAHSRDLSTDPVLTEAGVFALSETWTDIDEELDIEGLLISNIVTVQI